MRGARRGFTLLELLVVIAIIGAVAGAFAWWMMGSVRRAEVRGAAYQLVGDLRRSRSQAQKTGVPQTVNIQDGTSGYTLKVGASPATPRTLDKGVRVLKAIGDKDVTYQPPFGTLAADGTVWEVRSPAYPNVPSLFVKVVGITGKVMVSATQN